MCTKITKEIKDANKYGWKVVEITNLYGQSAIKSTLHRFYWKVGQNSTNCGNIVCTPTWIDQSDVFHFFPNRKQARTVLKDWNSCYYHRNFKIIRLKLMGKVYEGTHSGMGDLNDKPALCATQAEWDGKFHR